MAAQILRRGQAIVWVPPRAIGERAFATEASLLAMLPAAAMRALLSGADETAITPEAGFSTARYARISFDALPPLRSVTLVFDARDVTLLRAKVPPLSGTRLQQALPNIAEDSLLQDPQQCGFALGPRTGEDERLIAAIDRAWLEHVIDAFERRGAKVQAAWPAQLALPTGDSSAALACVNSGLALRTGPLDGLGWNAADEASQRAEAIVSLLQTAWPAEQNLAKDVSAAGETPDAAELSAEAEPSGVRRLTVFVDGPHWQPAVTLAAEELGFSADIRSLPLPVAAPIDLLAARHGNAARRWLADIEWRDWRVPAALALATIATALLGLNIQWGMLSQERAELRASIERHYRQAFPEAQVIVDPVLQMERQVAGLRTRAGQSGSEDFIPLLTRFAQALGAQAADSMAGVDYRENRLRVRFQPGQFESRATRQSLVQAAQRLGLELHFDSDREPTASVTLLR